MSDLEFFNNYADAVCAFSGNGNIVFKNNVFQSIFCDFKSLERFKKRFNFNLCLLSTDSIKDITPIDILLKSEENFHSICSYQSTNDYFLYFYIYSFYYGNYKIVVFKNITNDNKLSDISKKYDDLSVKYKKIKEDSDKFYKLQEQAQTQVLKMGIINRISLVIRETNDIENIIASALEEIHNLLGAYKTYFSMKEKNKFRIIYSVTDTSDINTVTEYEEAVIKKIKEKDIFVSSCLKEYLNAENFLQKGVTRIIIPVYNKNKLLGIIVILTKQIVNIEENKEILQSISVQLAGSIIQAGLIRQLNKKNNKLAKTLNELKETQLQLINSEKMASLGQLVSGVAHEINTPLASISSNNDIINRILSSSDKVSENNIRILRDLNNIDIEAARRISNIVKSLKRFVRLDEAEFQEADINKELDLTLKLIHHETKNKIEIIKNYGEIPPVYCYVNMLNQVFMNILINACHSFSQSGINPQIFITTSYDSKNLTVRIRDNGSGIPASIQSKIFNVGFTTKKVGLGSGFGLAISKKIIELHKGTIDFISKENEGTEFIITIPI